MLLLPKKKKNSIGYNLYRCNIIMVDAYVLCIATIYYCKVHAIPIWLLETVPLIFINSKINNVIRIIFTYV